MMLVLLALAVFLLLLPALLCLAQGGWLLTAGALALAVWARLICWVLAAWLAWRRGEDEYV